MPVILRFRDSSASQNVGRADHPVHRYPGEGTRVGIPRTVVPYIGIPSSDYAQFGTKYNVYNVPLARVSNNINKLCETRKL
eukprot:2582374-Rhodomonas_salina.2